MTASEEIPPSAAAATNDPRAVPPTIIPDIAQASVPTRTAAAQPWATPFSLIGLLDLDSSDDEDDDDDITATFGAGERTDHTHRRMISDMARLQREVFGAFSQGYIIESQFDDSASSVQNSTTGPRARQYDPTAAVSLSSQSPLSSLLSSNPSLFASNTSPADNAPLNQEPGISSATASSHLPSAAARLRAQAETDEDSVEGDDGTVNGRYMYFDEMQARVEAGVAMLRNNMAEFPSWLTPPTPPVPPLPTRNPNRTTTAGNRCGARADARTDILGTAEPASRTRFDDATADN